MSSFTFRSVVALSACACMAPVAWAESYARLNETGSLYNRPAIKSRDILRCEPRQGELVRVLRSQRGSDRARDVAFVLVMQGDCARQQGWIQSRQLVAVEAVPAPPQAR